MAPIPTLHEDRDRWILARRGPRHPSSPDRPQAFVVELERSASGRVVPVTTIFLTNRECPWRCVMCDLWKNTLTETVPSGAIPGQIDHALDRLGRTRRPAAAESVVGIPFAKEVTARHIKLYNSGSFFDRRAIPVGDYPAIADRIRHFDRVIVECHPALVGDRCLQFLDSLRCRCDGHRDPPELEVAMGLECANPSVLERLNKGMTLDGFRKAAAWLVQNGIALRAFVMVGPPFLPASAHLEWACRSVDFAFDCGADVVSLIPTRDGNGAMEALAASGEYTRPGLDTLEAALAYGVNLHRGRVFADLWDLERFSECNACFAQRRERLRILNLTQTPQTMPVCQHGEGQAP